MEDRQLKYIKTGIDFVFTAIRAILDHADGEDKAALLEEQKALIVDYIKMELEYNIGRDVLKKLQDHLEVKEGTVDTDMEKMFQDQYEEALQENAKDFDITSIKKHPRYREMEQKIKKDGGGVDANNDDDDEEGIVCSETNVYVDPWSKKNIEIPVKNQLCGHIYEKATALKMCSRAKGKVKCPVVGCANNGFKASDLKEDQQIKEIIQSQAL